MPGKPIHGYVSPHCSMYHITTNSISLQIGLDELYMLAHLLLGSLLLEKNGSAFYSTNSCPQNLTWL